MEQRKASAEDPVTTPKQSEHTLISGKSWRTTHHRQLLVNALWDLLCKGHLDYKASFLHLLMPLQFLVTWTMDDGNAHRSGIWRMTKIQETKLTVRSTVIWSSQLYIFQSISVFFTPENEAEDGKTWAESYAYLLEGKSYSCPWYLNAWK